MLFGRLAVRPARTVDIEPLERLQRLALRCLAASHYAPSDIEAALSYIGNLDPELIEDGTYYVAESEGRVVGCGGWSFRARLIPGTEAPPRRPSPVLKPHSDAARIRAVFVDPNWARRGIARRLIGTAEAAAQLAGFRRFALVSTLNAEPLYRSLGYRSIERVYVELPNQARLAAVRMSKEIGSAPAAITSSAA